ncbi:MAG: hypothetical protein Q4C79_04535 [Neisseria sp.]|uniref:ABC-three component system middle component 6 n=1 Tax=Neisseria sp. TaxID=192066 RepID=UPI0026DC7012|nr:ABC-three component system middle component 6 [Neisseria sp.]MDO4248221.1 hypothetical protein [Neisseria sp.]
MALLHPESDLSLSVVVMGASILEELSKKNSIMIDDLLTVFLKKDKRRTLVNFYATLEFLYTVDTIEHEHYHIRMRQQKMQPDMFD